MTTFAIIFLSLGWVTAGVLGIRIGAVKADAREADLLRSAAESALKIQTREFSDHKLRAAAQIDSLVKELERFEIEHLDNIENEPDRKVRIRRRRAWVSSVLSQTPRTESGDGSDGMSDRATPDS